MHSKIHNKTLFVAALSVYFGLLIAGAPHILAQQSANQEKQFCSDEINANYKYQKDLDSSLLITLSEIKKLLDETALDSNPTNFAYEITLSNSQSVDFQILTSDGNPQIISSLLEKAVAKVNTLQKGNLQKQLPFTGFLTDFKLGQSEIIYGITYTFDKTSKAKLFFDELCEVFANSKAFVRAKNSENKAITAFLDKLDFWTINNQVFIVTRLPRAALDEALKSNEKAN